jgi:hypothetical protein
MTDQVLFRVPGAPQCKLGCPTCKVPTLCIEKPRVSDNVKVTVKYDMSNITVEQMKFFTEYAIKNKICKVHRYMRKNFNVIQKTELLSKMDRNKEYDSFHETAAQVLLNEYHDFFCAIAIQFIINANHNVFENIEGY